MQGAGWPLVAAPGRRRLDGSPLVAAWTAGAVRIWQTLTTPIYNWLHGLCWAA
jgi:hypothetical protein